MNTAPDEVVEFARLVREGRAAVIATDPFDGFLTVKAGDLTLDISPLTWWHVRNCRVSGPVYLAAEVEGLRHPGL